MRRIWLLLCLAIGPVGFPAFGQEQVRELTVDHAALAARAAGSPEVAAQLQTTVVERATEAASFRSQYIDNGLVWTGGNFVIFYTDARYVGGTTRVTTTIDDFEAVSAAQVSSFVRRRPGVVPLFSKNERSLFEGFAITSLGHHTVLLDIGGGLEREIEFDIEPVILLEACSIGAGSSAVSVTIHILWFDQPPTSNESTVRLDGRYVRPDNIVLDDYVLRIDMSAATLDEYAKRFNPTNDWLERLVRIDSNSPYRGGLLRRRLSFPSRYHVGHCSG